MKIKFGPARDVILLISGLLLLGYETLISAEPRVILIMVAATMIGLPATFVADRRFTNPFTPSSTVGTELPTGEETTEDKESKT